MRTKRRLLFAALFLAAIGGIVWLVAVPREPPEPMYQGKPLTFWLGRGYFHPANFADQQAATAAVRQAGTNAIPTLLRLMRARDSKTKAWVFNWLHQHPRLTTPFIDAPSKNWETFYAFRQLGRDARPAVPELIQIYETSLDTDCADIIPNILVSLGPDDAGTVPALLRVATHSTNNDARVRAIQSLGWLHAQPEIVVPALANCLRDLSKPVRANAIVSLIPFGTNGIPYIFNMLNDPDPGMRMIATNALKEIKGLNSINSK